MNVLLIAALLTAEFSPTGAFAKPAVVYETTGVFAAKLKQVQTLVSAESAPTPYSEVVRVLALLPKPEIGFVDFGCGADARWCVAAAERWRCRCIGIEIDPARVSAARNHVMMLGLSDLIMIVEGDAITTNVNADVGVAYLWADVLVKLKPQVEKLKAFASYLHQPPVPSTKNGDTWLYTKPVQVTQKPRAVWNGFLYEHVLCHDPNCPMCNGPVGIARQLAMAQTKVSQPPPVVAQSQVSQQQSRAAVYLRTTRGVNYYRIDPDLPADATLHSVSNGAEWRWSVPLPPSVNSAKPTDTKSPKPGHWVSVKHCDGIHPCWYENVWVEDK